MIWSANWMWPAETAPPALLRSGVLDGIARSYRQEMRRDAGSPRRTRDIQLGKLTLCQLSYSRSGDPGFCRAGGADRNDAHPCPTRSGSLRIMDPWITAVAFDLGGVLIDWDPRYLYRTLFDDEPAMEDFLATVTTHEWNQAQDAGRPWAEAIQALAESHPEQRDLIEAYWLRWPETLGDAIEPTVELLDELRSTGIRLYALSNWSGETFPLARPRYPFLEWFDGIVISGDERVAKPDPRIFAVLLERYGLAAAETLFIDDHVPNVEAAATLGFTAIRIRRRDRPPGRPRTLRPPDAQALRRGSGGTDSLAEEPDCHRVVDHVVDRAWVLRDGEALDDRPAQAKIRVVAQSLAAFRARRNRPGLAPDVDRNRERRRIALDLSAALGDDRQRCLDLRRGQRIEVELVGEARRQPPRYLRSVAADEDRDPRLLQPFGSWIASRTCACAPSNVARPGPSIRLMISS